MELLFKFETLDSGYKIIYQGTQPLFVNITALLKGLDLPVQTIRFRFQMRGQWFIPDLDYTGVSKIELRDIDTGKVLLEKLIHKRFSEKSKNQNVICIGLNKTGTTSFTNALKQLGYVMFSEPSQFHYLSTNTYHGDWFTTLSVLNNPRYNLYNDQPFSSPSALDHIYENRPNDIYVLTVRKNPESWYESVIKFYDSLSNQSFEDNSYIHTRWTNDYEKILINHITTLYDSWGIENNLNLKEKLISTYNKHVEDSINFFKGKNCNFRIVDVSKKNELKNFTNWLGIESELTDFPWDNKGQQ